MLSAIEEDLLAPEIVEASIAEAVEIPTAAQDRDDGSGCGVPRGNRTGWTRSESATLRRRSDARRMIFRTNPHVPIAETAQRSRSSPVDNLSTQKVAATGLSQRPSRSTNVRKVASICVGQRVLSSVDCPNKDPWTTPLSLEREVSCPISWKRRRDQAVPGRSDCMTLKSCLIGVPLRSLRQGCHFVAAQRSAGDSNGRIAWAFDSGLECPRIATMTSGSQNDPTSPRAHPSSRERNPEGPTPCGCPLVLVARIA